MIILRQKEFGLFGNKSNKQTPSLNNSSIDEKSKAMEIEDIWSVNGNVYVTGKAISDINSGDNIKVVSKDNKYYLKSSATVQHELGKNSLSAKSGENIGLMLDRSIDKNSIHRGDKIYLD